MAFPALSVVALALCASCISSGVPQRTAADLLAEPRYSWISDSTTHTRLHYLAGSAAIDSSSRIRAQIEESWQEADRFIGMRADRAPIDVFIVPRREMVAQVAQLPTEANALNFWKTRVVIAQVTSRGWPGPHEIVHIMAYESWGEATEWWLGEGVAVAAGRWAGADVHAYAKCLSDAGKLYPMSALVPRPAAAADARVTYPQAGSFVRFLIERYGRDRIARVYPKGASALPTVYGKDLAALEREWRDSLASVEAHPACRS